MTLIEPVRCDDAEQIIAAIKMIKGVVDVVPVVADAGTYWGRSTARRELLKKIWDLMQQENV